jgi:hypothetical protein
VRGLAPARGALASGGKDSLVKLWDAKSGKGVASLHAHKNQVGALRWNQNGNWLATGCRGQQLKVFDVRTLRELENFRGHQKEITSLAWHPHHETYSRAEGSTARSCTGSWEGARMTTTRPPRKETFRLPRKQTTRTPPARGRARRSEAGTRLRSGAWRGTPRGTSCAVGPTTTPASSGAATGRGRCRGTRACVSGPAALAEQALMEAQISANDAQRPGGRGGRVPRRDGGCTANGTRGGAGGVPGVRTGTTQAAAAGAAAGRAAKRAAAGAAACAAPGRAEGRPPAGAAAGPPAGRAAGRAAGPSAGPRAGGEEAEEGTAGVVMFRRFPFRRTARRTESDRIVCELAIVEDWKSKTARARSRVFLSIREAAGVARLVPSRKRRRRRRLGREGNGANGRVRDVHGGDCRMSFTGYATTRLPSGRRS